jgi:hypothetical protein
MDLKKTLYFFSSIHYNEAKLHFERMFTMEENKNSSNIRIPRVLYNCLLGFFVIVFLVSLILIARYSIESFRNSQGYNDLAGLKKSLQNAATTIASSPPVRRPSPCRIPQEPRPPSPPPPPLPQSRRCCGITWPSTK